MQHAADNKKWCSLNRRRIRPKIVGPALLNEFCMLHTPNWLRVCISFCYKEVLAPSMDHAMSISIQWKQKNWWLEFYAQKCCQTIIAALSKTWWCPLKRRIASTAELQTEQALESATLAAPSSHHTCARSRNLCCIEFIGDIIVDPPSPVGRLEKQPWSSDKSWRIWFLPQCSAIKSSQEVEDQGDEYLYKDCWNWPALIAPSTAWEREKADGPNCFQNQPSEKTSWQDAETASRWWRTAAANWSLQETSGTSLQPPGLQLQAWMRRSSSF